MKTQKAQTGSKRERRGFGHFVREFHAELKKVEWPGQRQLLSATVVVMMGLRSRDDIARRLIARGWDTATPAAVLVAASTAGAETWMGSLGELAQPGPATSGDSHGAGTVVIGDVVRVGQQLAGRLQRPARDIGIESEAVESEVAAARAAGARALAR